LAQGPKFGSTYQRLTATAPFTISNSRTTAIRKTGGPSGIKWSSDSQKIFWKRPRMGQ
jgi:hypothetical protein